MRAHEVFVGVHAQHGRDHGCVLGALLFGREAGIGDRRQFERVFAQEHIHLGAAGDRTVLVDVIRDALGHEAVPVAAGRALADHAHGFNDVRGAAGRKPILSDEPAPRTVRQVKQAEIVRVHGFQPPGEVRHLVIGAGQVKQVVRVRGAAVGPDQDRIPPELAGAGFVVEEDPLRVSIVEWNVIALGDAVPVGIAILDHTVAVFVALRVE